ncbi:Dopey, N-terminal domain-containing protein [Toxoplasma gondii MAS]|uniref:Dopey, N-terminal domain-containing protein n=1 Tax=Toxoplasma gondii MAS TaxID=943118 RepID=A0A086QUT3_TOXGO|nr:Dopey, N-terminal domain-containing protein [Toxoplasma gondii MAS]
MFSSLAVARPRPGPVLSHACSRSARAEDAFLPPSRLAFSAALPFINGLAQVLQFLVDTATSTLDAGVDGEEQSRGGALLPFFDLFAWSAAPDSGGSVCRQVEAKLAHVTALLPTIVVACLTAVSATLPRSSWRAARSRLRAKAARDRGRRPRREERTSREDREERRDRSERDPNAQVADLDAKRNEETVRMRVTAIVDTLFKA